MSTEEGTIVQYNTEEWATTNENLVSLKTSLDSLSADLVSIVTDTLMQTGIAPESATGKELIVSFQANVVSEIDNFSAEIGNFVTKSGTDEGVATEASAKAVAAARG